MQIFQFTKNEKEIMELLWAQKRSMSRTEIIELSPDRSWKSSSIHILLNQLLNKGAIEVDGFIKTGKNYGRTFKAIINEEDYYVMLFKSSDIYKKSPLTAITHFLNALFDDMEVDDNLLDQIEEILENKRISNKQNQ